MIRHNVLGTTIGALATLAPARKPLRALPPLQQPRGTIVQRVMRATAVVLSAAACGGDGSTPVDPPPPVATASVRFFNATPGMTGNGGFTTNGQFAVGSALPFGQSTQTCSKVSAVSTSFGFGAANPNGAGLSGSALTSLGSQSISADGNYIVASTGSATDPTLFLLDNSFPGTLGANQAAIRFVNLAPGAPSPFTVLRGTLGTGPTSLVAGNLAVGAPTAFVTVASGANAYTILQGHETVISGNAATLSLQPGTVNTVAIVRSPSTANGFQLINLPRC